MSSAREEMYEEICGRVRMRARRGRMCERAYGRILKKDEQKQQQACAKRICEMWKGYKKS